jgi:hypothetical protein
MHDALFRTELSIPKTYNYTWGAVYATTNVGPLVLNQKHTSEPIMQSETDISVIIY